MGNSRREVLSSHVFDIEIDRLDESCPKWIEFSDRHVDGLLLDDRTSCAFFSFEFFCVVACLIARSEEEPLTLSGRGQMARDIKKPSFTAPLGELLFWF